MKLFASPILLLCLAVLCASRVPAADAKPEPSQYTLAVHIPASTYALPIDRLNEVVTATIDGKHYELHGPASSAKIFSHGKGLINPGDYHASLTQDEHKTSYESLQQFEILFPDGTARRFSVVAQLD